MRYTQMRWRFIMSRFLIGEIDRLQTVNIFMIKLCCFVGISVSTFLTFCFCVWRHTFLFFSDVVQLVVKFLCFYLFFSSLLNEVHHENEVHLVSFLRLGIVVSHLLLLLLFALLFIFVLFWWISGGGPQYAILPSLAFTFLSLCSFLYILLQWSVMFLRWSFGLMIRNYIIAICWRAVIGKKNIWWIDCAC